MKFLVKTQNLHIFLFLTFCCLVLALSGCANENDLQESQKFSIQENMTNLDEYVIDENDFLNGKNIIAEIPKFELTESEIEGLILMREEEKLAKDVYIKLGEKWGMKIFSNISSSEQTHTDAVKTLLDRYNIEDPVKSNEIGLFRSSDLQGLYNQLMEKGEKSLLDALIVGITIEDLDIYDLNTLLEKTKNSDIIAVYNNLARGSRNHMRAFMRQINKNGGVYFPQYISQIEFNGIINSEQEKSGNK